MAKGQWSNRGRKTNGVGGVLSFFLGAFLAIAGYHPITQKESSYQQSLTPRSLPHYSTTPLLHYSITPFFY